MEKKNSQTALTLVIVMITSFITPFMSNAINLAIPAIGEEFLSNQNQLNWVVSGFLISTAVFLLPFGRIADQFGRKRIFLIGMGSLSVASLGCALAPSLDLLIFFRVLQGAASAMIFGTSMAILTSVIPAETRGRALGMVAAATYVGLSSGPVLGGLISSAFNWRAIFYFNLLVAIVVLILTLWKLRGEWKGESYKLDSVGIVLIILSQALLLFGLSNFMKGLIYQLSFVLGAALLVAFFAYEKKHRNPLIPIASIAKNRPFTFANIATLINYSATFALGFILSLYLQNVLKLDAAVSGLILLVQPVLMAVLSPVTGILSDKIKPYVLASSGMGVSALGLSFFVFLSASTPIFLIILDLAFIGIGFSLFATPNTNAIMSSVDKKLYGVASSILGNMRVLGQAISMAIVSIITTILISDLPIGSQAYVGQLLSSLRIAFIIFAVVCVLGVFASLVHSKANQPN